MVFIVAVLLWKGTEFCQTLSASIDDHVLFTFYSVNVVCVCWPILASQGWIPLGHDVWSFSCANNLVCMWHYSLPLKEFAFAFLAVSICWWQISSGFICLKIFFIAFLMKDIYWYRILCQRRISFVFIFEMYFCYLLASTICVELSAISHYYFHT